MCKYDENWYSVRDRSYVLVVGEGKVFLREGISWIYENKNFK